MPRPELFRTAKLAAIFFSVALCAVGHAAPPSAEAFFSEPTFSHATLSPDGRKVAFLVRSKSARVRLGVIDLETMKPQGVAGIDSNDLRRVSWVNDKRLVFDLKTELTGPGYVDAGPGLFAVNSDGTEFRNLIEIRPTYVRPITDGPELLPWNTSPTDVPGKATGNDIFVARAQEVSRRKVDYIVIHRLNTLSGGSTELEVPLHTVHWALDNQGDVRAVLTAHEGRQAMHLRQADGKWKQISEFASLGGDGLSPLWVGPDDTLYVSAPAGDKAAVYALNAATGKTQGAPLAMSKDFDLHPQFIANDKQLLGLRYTVDAEVTQWLDPDMQALQALVDKRLPATSNRLSVPRHGDAPWVMVQAFADVQPTITYALHRPSGKLTALNGGRAGIAPAQLGQTDFVRYKARDGRDIPAYLTLPPGSGKNLPLVVLVHGGPWVRGGQWQFDAEVQFLASRGYAVLQPEFRGSTGFGYEHMAAGFKQWGRAMQDDLADGARWAIAQGHANAKRICIAGASYGGYATLMGLIREPELFRCGINWIGVTDINLLFSVGWSDSTEEFKKYGLRQMVGDPAVPAEAEMLKSVSPLENAAKIQQPLLMAYGAWDTRVPLVHGEKFLAAIKPHNKNVEWVVYPKEGHGWSKPETKIDFWNRVESFLAKNIGAP
jgi:dienelactone hydrolase